MSYNEILSEKNEPFTDRMAAQIKAETISEETGIHYRVKEVVNGFVVVRAITKVQTEPNENFAETLDELDNFLSVSPEEEPEFLKIEEKVDETVQESSTCNTEQIVEDIIASAQTNKVEHDNDQGSKAKNHQVCRDINFRPAWRGQINYHLMASLGLIFALFNKPIMALGLTEQDMINMQDWILFWEVLQSIGYGVFLYALLMSYINVVFYKYTLTAKSLTASEGIISRKKPTVGIEDINKNEIIQSVLERILNIGTIELSTAGTGDIDVYLRGISDPEQMQEIIDKRRKG